MLFAVIDSKKVTKDLITAPKNSKVFPFWETAEIEKGSDEVVGIVGANWENHTADPLVMDPSIKHKVLVSDKHPILVVTDGYRETQSLETRMTFILNAVASVCQQAHAQAVQNTPMICQPLLLNYLLSMVHIFMTDFAEREGMVFGEAVPQILAERQPVLFGPDGDLLSKRG